MTVVNFLLIIVVLFILIKLNSLIREYIRKNKYEILNLQSSLDKLGKKLEDKEFTNAKSVEEKLEVLPVVEELEEEVSDPDSIPLVAYAEQPREQVPDLIKDDKQSDDKVSSTPSIEAESQQVHIPNLPIEEHPPELPPEIHTPEIPHIEKEPKKTFFEKYPDLEKFIGENLINKIGIVILVLGLGYLVKYAIDKNWINEIARVAIGVLSAGGLIGIAHRLRKEYKPFSSVLIGGGLALLYFTITLAFHTEGYPLYQQQTLSFIILIFITLFAVFLSISYNRIEIAILAIIGGFASPLLLSTGSGNYIVLFSYIMLLNVGMLVLSYYKKWRLVNIVAFGFTVLLFGLWLFGELDADKYINFIGAVFFATGFFVIFFLMNIIYNLKYSQRFKVGDISLILSNTIIYFSFMMIMLTHINDGAFKGLFSVLLGVFNFVFAYLIHKRKSTDNSLLYLLIGLVFTFITLAIPLQLDGNHITLFWSLEAVLLLWLSQKSGFKIMKIGSIVVLGLMLISITMDWDNNYNIVGYFSEGYIKEFPIIFNKMFMTTMVSAISLIGIFILLRNEKETFIWQISVSTYRLIIISLSLIIFYIGGLLEVNYQAFHYFIQESSQMVASITYNALFVLSLLIYAYLQKNREVAIAAAVLSTSFVLVFLFLLSSFYAKTVYSIISGEEILSTTLLIFRWVSVVAVYIISILLYKMRERIGQYFKYDLSKYSITFLVFTIIYLISADLDTIGVLIANSKDVLIHTQKTGYAIIWGVSSFLLMIIGMRAKNKTLRILSLVLFAITLIKLFVYDIAEISKGGKIIAFILLGVLLLIISFMYQKVKLLVTEEDPSIGKEDNQNQISE